MTKPVHSEIFELMGQLLEMFPTLRVGQLICNALMYTDTGDYHPSVGNIDDELLIVALENHLRSAEQFRARSKGENGESDAPLPSAVTRTSIKSEARKLIDRMADDATWEDLIYHCSVRQLADGGLKDADRGLLVSVSDIRASYGLPG